MSITIKRASKETTEWFKKITFEYEGEIYFVTLNWSAYDGYDITFKNKHNSTPKWAQKLIDVDNGDENLYEILDNLTEAVSV